MIDSSSSDALYVRLADTDSTRSTDTTGTEQSNAGYGYFNEQTQRATASISRLHALVQTLNNSSNPDRASADEASALAEDIGGLLQQLEDDAVASSKGQVTLRRQRRFQVKKLAKDFARVGAGLEAAMRHAAFAEAHVSNSKSNTGAINEPRMNTSWSTGGHGQVGHSSIMDQEMEVRQQEQDSALQQTRVEQQMAQHLIQGMFKFQNFNTLHMHSMCFMFGNTASLLSGISCSNIL
jgi:hypothetical protein